VERRITLRMSNNLAERLKTIARSKKKLSLNRHIVRCLEKYAKEDGKPVAIV
jgi:predicted HicB family RNase H-like nuclease